MSTDITRLRERLQAAERDHAAATRALYRDNQPIHTPSEHARRVRELDAARARARAEVAAAAQAIIDESQPLVAGQVDDLDLLDALTPGQVAEATAIAPFIKEDVDELSPDALAERISRLVQGYDRVRQVLVLRYGRRAVAQAEAAGPAGGPELPEGVRLSRRPVARDLTPLKEPLKKLAARLDPDLSARQQAAERADQAGRLLSELTVAARQADRLEALARRPVAGLSVAH